jgi:hypothetical protein
VCSTLTSQCNRFVELSVTGSRQGKVQTTVKKSKYDADFGEEFFFALDSDRSRRAPELNLTVLDWDRVGNNELIGSVNIVLGEGSDDRRNYVAPKQQKEYSVLSPAGASVKGHDSKVWSRRIWCAGGAGVAQGTCGTVKREESQRAAVSV